MSFSASFGGGGFNISDRISIDLGVSDVLRDFAQLRDVLGTSSAAASELSVLGGAFGVRDIRGAAEALQRATISGGQGSAVASQLGLPINPFLINQGDLLLRALEGLRATAAGPGGREQAVFQARALHLEDWLGVIYLADEQFQRIKEMSAASAALFTPERIAEAQLFNAEMSLFNQTMQDLTVTIGTMFLPTITEVLSWLTNQLRALAGQPVSSVNGPAEAMNGLRGAIQENTATLRQMQGGFGGGARARGAIPGAYGVGAGQFLQQNMRALSNKMGAYSVNF